MTNIIQIQQISNFSIKDITASLPRGQIIGIVGPDGAGKTTLIRLITGLLKPSKGSIIVDGFDTMKDAHRIHERIGYMPQKFGLYEDLSVMQNLKLYAELRELQPEEEKATFDKLLHFTDLKQFENRLAGALSGGMKQKLGLACALIKKPILLLLDEPSVGVDPISRRELWQMVNDLLQEGISVVWSTSYLDEAEKCDTVLLLNEGQLLFQGKPQTLTERVTGRVFLKPSEDPRKLLTEMQKDPNVLDCVIQGNAVRIVTKTVVPGLASVKPRFEDAFMDFLGGIKQGGSPLASMMTPIPNDHRLMIESTHLTKKFGNFTAAQNINLKIPQGEIFGLLGPNGAGKTTTFKMLCGLLKPSEGSSLVGGIDLQVAPGEARAHMGYMAQKFSLYGNLSVKQNLDFFSGVYNLSGKKREDAVQQMISIFDLQPYLNETAEMLSLGFKQRLALSCSLMHHPLILFLDEPTSGVDPITRREFWSHIYGLVDKGMTIMITTHFMDEAEYCDRIGLVYKSKLIQVGSPAELKKISGKDTIEDAFIQIIEAYDQHSKA